MYTPKNIYLISLWNIENIYEKLYEYTKIGPVN